MIPWNTLSEGHAYKAVEHGFPLPAHAQSWEPPRLFFSRALALDAAFVIGSLVAVALFLST